MRVKFAITTGILLFSMLTTLWKRAKGARTTFLIYSFYAQRVIRKNITFVG